MVGCLQSCRGAEFAGAPAVVGGRVEWVCTGLRTPVSRAHVHCGRVNPHSAARMHELHASKKKKRKKEKRKKRKTFRKRQRRLEEKNPIRRGNRRLGTPHQNAKNTKEPGKTNFSAGLGLINIDSFVFPAAGRD